MNQLAPDTAATLRPNALSGIQYLVNHIREDGSFVYEQNARTGAVSDNYNILRHAGCCYVLYQSLNAGLASPQGTLPVLEKATAYLLRQIEPVTNRPGMSAVVERKTAKLGGSALALIALIERHRFQPDPKMLPVMRELASFLVWMQLPAGKFRSNFDNKKELFGAFESTYYPGQAILALTSLWSIDPDDKWLQAAELGAHYLVVNPATEQGRKVNNHWFAIAIAQLYFINSDQALYHALCEIVDICIWEIGWRLPKPVDATGTPSPKEPHYASAWATFGESFVAAIQVEKRLGHFDRVDMLLPHAHQVVEACLQLQIRFKDPVYRYYTFGGIRENEKKNRVRIDFVQHVLAVIIGLLPPDQPG
jgi:hypothetical protein